MKYLTRIAPLLIQLVASASVGCAGSAPSTVAPSAASGADPGSARPDPARPGALLQPAREGAFVTSTYRNLFVELGLPAPEVEARVRRAYQALFHGAPEDTAVMFDAGQNERGPLAYIFDVGNDDVRSEGMSYGMMIALQMNEKRDFDALWNWAKTYMQVSRKDHPVSGYFAWKMRRDGSAADEMPAPDGEEYFATALLFAAHRWGSGTGIYDYRSEAHELLASLRHRKAITGMVNGSRKTSAVALFNPEHKMVRFTPDQGNFATNGDHTDPSYHLPAFYEVWALWGPEADRGFWSDAARASRDHFVQATHPETGLSPDYSNFDGTPKAASWDAHTADFRYDAWRTGMNWAVDSAWWSKDPRQTQLSNRLLGFFAEQGPRYPSTYTLDGTATSQDHSLGLVATNAVAALAASDPSAARFVQALYEEQPPQGKWRYYNGMLYMMGLLQVSGNFRIYAPQPG